MTKRKTSFLWEYFDPRGEKKACCNLCKHHISYRTSTSNLKRHIERRHPVLLRSEKDPLTNESDSETLKKDESNAKTTEDRMENIFIEYCDDIDLNEEETNIPPEWKVLRNNSILQTSSETQPTEKVKQNEPNSKFSNLAQSRDELIRIEIELARKDLELKELQVIHAKQEEERKEKEHKITMKIKEAQLETILSQKKNV